MVARALGTARREKKFERGERNRVSRIEPPSASLRYPVEATHEAPSASTVVLAGFSLSEDKNGSIAKRLPMGRTIEEEGLPISALLARIRRLVPTTRDEHYDEIVRSFGVGDLRPPPTPMTDGELARAIAEFLKETPSTEAVATLGRRLDPSSPL